MKTQSTVEPSRGATAPSGRIERPVGPRRPIERPELLRRLAACSGQPILTVIAPPGYGKTASIALWDDADPRPFAWVRVDQLDDNPSHLARHLATSLDAVAPVDDTRHACPRRHRSIDRRGSPPVPRPTARGSGSVRRRPRRRPPPPVDRVADPARRAAGRHPLGQPDRAGRTMRSRRCPSPAAGSTTWSARSRPVTWSCPTTTRRASSARWRLPAPTTRCRPSWHAPRGGRRVSNSWRSPCVTTARARPDAHQRARALRLRLLRGGGARHPPRRGRPVPRTVVRARCPHRPRARRAARDRRQRHDPEVPRRTRQRLPVRRSTASVSTTATTASSPRCSPTASR